MSPFYALAAGTAVVLLAGLAHGGMSWVVHIRRHIGRIAAGPALDFPLEEMGLFAGRDVQDPNSP